MKKLILLICCFVSIQIVVAQKELPIIEATSKFVDIRDGNSFQKASWNITPEAKPDIYYTNSIGKIVTFITDKGSISVKITPKTKFDFLIRLNEQSTIENSL